MEKISGADGIPVELFHQLTDDSMKSATLNMPGNLKNSPVETGLENFSFQSNPKGRHDRRMSTLSHIFPHVKWERSNA